MIRQSLGTLPYLFLKTENIPRQQPRGSVETEADANEKDEEPWYVCRNCHQRITRPSQRTTIQGNHIHTFANPSGVVFEIACFASATGFSFMGPSSTDFTWFSGHSWRISICSACLIHIGWYFSSADGGSFFGLIVDRLLMLSLPKQ